jgi:hypothetical protein
MRGGRLLYICQSGCTPSSPCPCQRFLGHGEALTYFQAYPTVIAFVAIHLHPVGTQETDYGSGRQERADQAAIKPLLGKEEPYSKEGKASHYKDDRRQPT